MKTKSAKDAAPRNPLAWAPIMKKGGKHQKSRKADRASAKQLLRKEWDYQAAFLQVA